MRTLQRPAMVIDAARCIHCDACVVACKAENAVPPGHSRNRVAEQEVGAFPEVSVLMAPAQCMQCDAAPCVSVCPTGASYRDAAGLVQVNADDCIGCRYCIAACPYDARYFDSRSGTVDKCTFCTHRMARGLEPACVATCPTRTRMVGDLADAADPVARLASSGRADVRLPHAGTQPKVFYLRGDLR
jgi:Fe-S-cluster-containing dehydrogenase component